VAATILLFLYTIGLGLSRAALTERQPWRPIVVAMLDDMRR
jgi:hypothetical protein